MMCTDTGRLHLSLKPFLLLLGSLLFGFDAQAQFTTDREPPGPSARTTGLAITEIMYHPVHVFGVDTNTTTLEFIEIYNSKPWDENISGFSISGDVNYTFGSNTTLAANSYLVIARVPGLIETTYGITNVAGPWDGAETNRLSIERGLVQLLNRQGAVLLEVDYRDSPPWPEGADGTGHSLVLARPSHGEAQPEAWAQSDTVGGSPGGPDPLTADALAAVVINEWQNHSDPVDWVELYNHGNTALNLSGAYLSDAPDTNFFRIPNGTIIEPRGFVSFDQDELDFELFAGGETIFFWSTNRARVIDVVDFRGQSNNVSTGRSPDGGPFTYTLASRTRGGPNALPARYSIVMTEIMYNPPSGDDNLEYIEIHNRSDRAANLSGWLFDIGIDYVFPTNALTINMPAGAYWVVAKDPETFSSVYTNISTNSVFGPYDGTLANGGERLMLAAADYDRVGGIEEKLPVPVADITYFDGGKWSDWSDGNGSSLELIDVDSDPRLPASWADSKTLDAPWTAVEMEVPIGETLGPEINDRLNVFLQGVGECLIDEVEVRVDGGPNLVVNGGFESGLDGWSLQGSHDFSTLEATGFHGGQCLHLRAGSRGENQSNRILSAPFSSPFPPGARMVSIRCKARWINGSREILMRLHGSATEAFGTLAISDKRGTPGQVNSQDKANVGPGVHDVEHRPILPAESEPVIVSGRFIDPQFITSRLLRYRVDPSPAYIDLPMLDNGTSGDAVANDGIYSATIPGQPAGTLAAFFVQGQDSLGATGTFPPKVFPAPGFDRMWPNDAVSKECVVRWGEVQMPGDFATYHLWVTSGNSNRWHTRDAMNNTEVDGTFVYNNSRVIYNAIPLYSGSPWHRTNSTTGPAGINRVDYEMNFPDDQLFLGAKDFVLNNSGNPDQLTVTDHSAIAEQTIYALFEGMGLPHNHRRYIHFFVNGSQRSTIHERPGSFIFEDSQQPNGDMVEQWFPNQPRGDLYKVEDWFEMHANGFDIIGFNDADLERREVPIDGEPTLLPAPYRYMYRKRSSGGTGVNNYDLIYQLIDAASPPDNPDSPAIDVPTLGAVVDWELWMRHFALQRTVGNFDSYGWERGKNDYLYYTTNGFVHMPWDIDYGLGLGRGPTEPLFESNDPRVLAMFNTPEIARAYWRAFHDIVNGPFSNEYLDPFIDARTTALLANNINIDLDAVAAVKDYISQRRTYLQSQLATVEAPFELDGNGSVESSHNLFVLTGSAPIHSKFITLNGVVYPVTWTSVTTFELLLVVDVPLSQLLFEGMNREGQPLTNLNYELFVSYTGPEVNPFGSLIISEIMYDPELPGGQFIELMNTSEQSFNLSGWRIDGLNYTFPPGSIITNHQTIVLAQNADVFEQLHGSIRIYDEFPGTLSGMGEIVELVKVSGTDEMAVDAVRYESAQPWPLLMPGESLQLIDATQDNGRVLNWGFDETTRATPGAPNSIAGALAAFDPLWLNEVLSDNLGGTPDGLGDPDPWIELHNSGGTLLNLDGFYLAQQYDTNLFQWPFPAGTMIEPGEFMVLWADGEPEETVPGEIHTDFRINFSGMLALVKDEAGLPVVVDYLTFLDPGANASYGSFPDGQAVYRFKIPGPSPGETNYLPTYPIYINEWLAGNNTGELDPADADNEDWFELHNAGPNPIDLGGFFLTDNPMNPAQFQVPDNGQYVIPPGGFLLVWADEEPNQNSPNRTDLHVNFRLAGDGGTISIYEPDGLTEVNRVTYGLQIDDMSEGRFTDGTGAIYPTTFPTPRERNVIPAGNLPPVFDTIAPQFLFPGNRITISVRPTEPDGQMMTFDFSPKLPGAGINSSGLFRWIVPADQPPGDYRFFLMATDIPPVGVQPRTGFGFTDWTVLDPGTPVVVPTTTPPPPVISSLSLPDGTPTLTIQSIPGQFYRVLASEDVALPVEQWSRVEMDFVAANTIASITDFAIGPRRFYQAAIVGQELLQTGPGDEAFIIPRGSVWKYLDDGSDAGTQWRDLGYDDSLWNSGAAELGYGDNPRTIVSFGADSDNKHIATYFRRTFSLGDPSIFLNLTVGLQRDDGGVVYLNGTEVFRSNMPAGAINHLTAAGNAVGGADESAFFSATVDPALLQPGNNVIAVEIHQSSGNSSDLSFDLDLSGEVQ